jgi:hypothetical protein
MDNMTKASFVVMIGVVTSVLISSSQPSKAQFGSDGGRWQMAVSESGLGAWRIDTETGYIQLCIGQAGQITCFPGSETGRN